MMKNKNSFSIEEAFESLESIDFEKADKILKESNTKIYVDKKNKKQVFLEALSILKEAEEKDTDKEEDDIKPYTLNLSRNSDDDISDAKEVFDDAEDVEVITDVNAESADDLKDSYIGDEILQCRVCKKTYFKSPEEVTKSEEQEEGEDVYNVEEECPHCGAKNGYNLIGQVAKKGTEEQKEEEAEEEQEETPVEEPTEEEVAEETAPEKGEEELDLSDVKVEESLTESKLTESKDTFYAEIDDKSYIQATTERVRNNYKVYERVYLTFVDKDGREHKSYGVESWINRPWHRFPFGNALYQALHKPEVEDLGIIYDTNDIGNKAYSVDDAIKKIAEAYNAKYQEFDLDDVEQVEDDSYQFDDEKFNESVKPFFNRDFKTTNVSFDNDNLIVEGIVSGPRHSKNVQFRFGKTKDNCYRGRCDSLEERLILKTAITEGKVFTVESILVPPMVEGKKGDERFELENELRNIYEGYDDSIINVIIKVYKAVTKDRHPNFVNVKNWVDSVNGLTGMLLTYGAEFKDKFTPKAIADIASHDSKLEQILRDRAKEYYDYDDFTLADEVVPGVKYSEEEIGQLANELIDLDDPDVLEDTLKDLSTAYLNEAVDKECPECHKYPCECKKGIKEEKEEEFPNPDKHEFVKTINGNDVYKCDCGKYVAMINGKKVKKDNLEDFESLKEAHIVKPDSLIFDNDVANWHSCRIEREKDENGDYDYQVYNKDGIYKYSSDDLNNVINYINKFEESFENESKISSTINEAKEDDEVNTLAKKNDSKSNSDTEIEKEKTLVLPEITLDSINDLASKVHEDGTYVYGKDKSLKKVDLDYGYQVSFFRPEITDAEISKCLSVIGDKMGPMYLGIWRGVPEISYCVDDIDKAQQVADIFNQEAVWDNGAEIAIPNPRFDEDDKVNYEKACDQFNLIAFKNDEDDEVSDIEGMVTTDIYDANEPKQESCKLKEEDEKIYSKQELEDEDSCKAVATKVMMSAGLNDWEEVHKLIEENNIKTYDELINVLQSKGAQVKDIECAIKGFKYLLDGALSESIDDRIEESLDEDVASYGNNEENSWIYNF